MSKILISVRFFVGAEAMSGRKIKYRKMRSLPCQKGIEAYTLIKCEGYYRGKREKSVIFEIHMDFPNKKNSDPSACVSEINKLNNLSNELRREFDQQEVIAEVVVRSHSRRVEWSHWSTVDSGKLFPFPAHIASLVWDVPVDRKTLDIPRFFHALTQSARNEFGKTYIPYEDLPLLVVPAMNSIELVFEKKIDKEKCRAFDDSIVERSVESLQKLDDRSFEAGSYIARFRQASKLPVFMVNNMDSLLEPTKNNSPRMAVKEAPYREGLGCSEMAYLDLLENWLKNNTVEFDRYKFLGCKRPMVSVLALTHVKVGHNGEVVIKRRSGNVGIYPNQYTCAPWGHLEPLLSTKPSVVEVFLQELDQELFGGPNIERDYDALIQRLGQLEGKLRYLGYAIDLLRPMVHILLTFEPLTGWWNKNRDRVRLNWEYEDEAIMLQDIAEVADGAKGEYVPATVATARLIQSQK